MASRGRPPVPAEVKRRRGTARADRGVPVNALATVSALPMAGGTPAPPADVGLEGRRVWEAAWSQGVTWIAKTDSPQLLEACRLVDDVAQTRLRFRATSDPADARALAAVSKQVTEAFSALGFTPTSRARLGVAEVKTANALEDLIARRSTGK